jgi:hypothetical protein
MLTWRSCNAAALPNTRHNFDEQAAFGGEPQAQPVSCQDRREGIDSRREDSTRPRRLTGAFCRVQPLLRSPRCR